MAERGQIRIIRAPKSPTNLHLANKLTLITPTKPALPKTPFYETNLTSVPLSLLLDPAFSNPAIVAHTQTSLTQTSATLIPKSLHIAIPNHLFPTLGLQPSRKLAPPQSIPPSRRPFVPVCLDLPLSKRNHARAKWALSVDRFDTFDITVSAGADRVKLPAGVNSTERVITSNQRLACMQAPRIGDDEDILDMVDNIQSAGTPLEQGDQVHLTEYQGLMNAKVIEEVVSIARGVAKECGWGVVMARAPPASLVWRNGVSRAGFAEGFGGDAAEILVCEGGKSISVQLRAGLDVV